jgi:hypothetical protein
VKAVGALFDAVWKRNSGALRPDGLLKMLGEKYDPDSPDAMPFEVIAFILHMIDVEACGYGENRSEIIRRNFVTAVIRELTCTS